MLTRVTGRAGEADGELPLRIGQLAERAGVSTRTLRYYEQLGLLAPAWHSRGGARRYARADAERLQRILELKALLGFNLEEVRSVLGIEDRLAELPVDYQDSDRERRAEILGEAIARNERLTAQVRGKIVRIEQFLGTLEEKAAWLQEARAELCRTGG